MTAREVKELFDRLRFDHAHHLGAGDIRLTIGQQDDIVSALSETAPRVTSKGVPVPPSAWPFQEAPSAIERMPVQMTQERYEHFLACEAECLLRKETQ